MHPTLQPYCGVDLAAAFPSRVNKDEEYFSKWRSNAMGVCSSPYNSVRGATLLKWLALQKKSDPTNPFGWDQVITNLPSSPLYDPRSLDIQNKVKWKTSHRLSPGRG